MVRIRRLFLAILFVAFCCAGAGYSKGVLRHSAAEIPPRDAPLYLPSAEYVKLITLGYNGFASDVLWFKTISFFGKHYRGDHEYRWFYEMCDLVTSLDPNASHVYEFCGTLLSWIANHPEDSRTILSKGVTALPDNWRIRYLRGFNAWYFLNRRDLAQQDLADAAQLPDAPPFLASLASRLMTDQSGPDTAVAFLSDMLRRSTDQSVRDALSDRLKRALLSRDLQLLQRASAEYVRQTGKAPATPDDLVAGGILKGIPPEPFGGYYYFEQPAGEPKTSSGERGLEFFGKTADTGLKKGL